MFRFPKIDLSKLDLPKFDPTLNGGPGTDRLAERMARLQRARKVAYTKWAQTYGQPKQPPRPAGGGETILDMEAPEATGGAWTAPGRIGAGRRSRGSICRR